MRIVPSLFLPSRSFTLTGKLSFARPPRRARRLQQLRLAPIAGLHRLHQPAADHRGGSRRRSAAPTSARRRRRAGQRPAAAAGRARRLRPTPRRAAALHAAASYAARHAAAARCRSPRRRRPARRSADDARRAGRPDRRRPAPRPGGTHLVQSGDTAWNISHRYGVSVDQLAAANGGSTNVKLGQRIVIPGGSGPQLAAPQPRAGRAARQPQSAGNAGGRFRRRPCRRCRPPPRRTHAAAAAGRAAGRARPADRQRRRARAAAPQPAAAADASGFRWPVRGRVISGFGKKPNGERNDGINLAVPEGTSVKAAEDGTVIYAGNELKSYGNLVLVRHNNGWVSAYAHNSELQVKRGDAVKRGQVDRALRHVRRRHHAAGPLRAPQGRDAGRPAAASDRELRAFRSPCRHGRAWPGDRIPLRS